MNVTDKAGTANPDIISLLRQHQPAVWVPRGETVESVRRSLASMSIDGSATGELAGYAEEDCERFLQTIALVPDTTGTLLEIGANPYFTSVLLDQHRPGLKTTKTNYFDGSVPEIRQTISLRQTNGSTFSKTYASRSVNVESDTFPWPDESFDVVLYCEVIEHLLSDPCHSLMEIWRLLKPGGCLILTTPNVARLENVARLIAGANLYDPYSGYGPYGRHNREFTRHELWVLLGYLGYDAEVLFSADVSPNKAPNYLDPAVFADLVRYRANDLGQYIFSRWIKSPRPPPAKRPSWLYRSLPPEQLEQIGI